MSLPERSIQSQVLQYLGYRGIKAFRINSGMIATGEGRNRRLVRLAPKGFSDIVGVLPESGRALFIEVKAPKGKLTIHQQLFLEEMRGQGAVAFVARSIEDCERELGEMIRR